jgi:hypothetical protein
LPDVALQCPNSPNDTGAYRLEWSGGGSNATYRLIESSPSGESVLYEGPDQASTVTGRHRGVYSYSLEVDGVLGDASVCEVEVSPPPLSLAFGLFGLGLFICAATVGLIARGHRRHRRGELG